MAGSRGMTTSASGPPTGRATAASSAVRVERGSTRGTPEAGSGRVR